MIELNNNFSISDLNLPQGAIPFEFVWVEPGKFTMGHVNAYSASRLVWRKSHAPIKVSITQGFWMAKYPTSRAHWYALGSNIPLEGIAPSVYMEDKFPGSTFNWQADNLPMYWVNWREAIRYCSILNAAYRDVLPAGYHFSLPTEAQWEYVARMGTADDIWPSNTINIDIPVKIPTLDEFSPNNWGVAGFLFSVRQFCFDISADYRVNDSYLEEFYQKDAEGYYIDFLCNNLNDGDHNNDFSKYDSAIRRIVKGGGDYSVDREDYKTGMKLSSLEYPFPPLGFRVCLRPITEYDLNDPLLLKEGINILG
jgi:hypothetical protein